jgi:hypothetical protein
MKPRTLYNLSVIRSRLGANGVKTGEMMLASAQVIGHRVTVWPWGSVANARDQREFSLMSGEKIMPPQNQLRPWHSA